MASDTTTSYAAGVEMTNSDIARLLNTYDENGFLLESHYQRDNRNDPACDASGVYGVRYERNELGQETAMTLYEPDESGNGLKVFLRTEYTYDVFGQIATEDYYDDNGDLF